MTDEQKKWIDTASYEDLLNHWRFAPVGDPFFAGDTGSYYIKVMNEKKKEADHVKASKKIGWAM